jgi:hypothetical protein
MKNQLKNKFNSLFLLLLALLSLSATSAHATGDIGSDLAGAATTFMTGAATTIGPVMLGALTLFGAFILFKLVKRVLSK